MNDSTSTPEPTLGQSVNDLREAANSTCHAVASEVSHLKDQACEAAQGRLQQAREYTSQKFGQIKEVASEKAQYVREKAEAGYNVARDQAQQFHDTSERCIQDNPFKAVGIAFGVGILVGFLLKR